MPRKWGQTWPTGRQRFTKTRKDTRVILLGAYLDGPVRRSLPYEAVGCRMTEVAIAPDAIRARRAEMTRSFMSVGAVQG